MARRDLSDPRMMLASPNQASVIFNPDGKHPIRQKHLFVVRFFRAVGGAAGNDWREGLTFVVKSMDRPSVEAQTETINQYNKKKVIHTGVKYNPINVTFYDTADGAAQNMWVEYARHYFADYNQSPESFRDDLLNDQLGDPSQNNSGWGFQLPTSSGLEDGGINSQHFLDRIEVIQLWGNEYKRYVLVNPRINSFTPDDLNYEDSGVATIQLSLSFEAIYHENEGRAQDLFTENSLVDMFTNGPLSGAVLQVSGPAKRVSFVTSTDIPGVQTSNETSIQNTTLPVRDEQTYSSVGGVLSRFGNFDFGSEAVSFDNVLATQSTQVFGGSTMLANVGKAGDQTVSAIGEAAIQIPGMAQGVNRATKGLGVAAIDQANRDNGLDLSDQIVREFNRLQDGTFLVGFRRPLNSLDG